MESNQEKEGETSDKSSIAPVEVIEQSSATVEKDLATAQKAWKPGGIDETVVGNPGDVMPERSGLSHVLKITDQLKANEIPCCLADVSALCYYGAARVMIDWTLCVPTDLLGEAVTVMGQNRQWEGTKPCSLRDLDDIKPAYPRFKVTGEVCFLIILSAQSCHLPCTWESIEYGKTGLPFPKLDVLAQSLLVTNNSVDLDDLIDGMNLSPEWGEQNLDLSALTDVQWIRWKKETAAEFKPRLYEIDDEEPQKVYDIWMKESSADRKRRAQGWKYHESYETRFWRRGQKDPRLREDWW